MRRLSLVAARIGACCLVWSSASVATPPKLKVVEINSKQIQKQTAEEKVVARTNAENTRQVITRNFIIGWEIHGGYFLLPTGHLDEMVSPQFSDGDVRGLFDTQYTKEMLATHVGQRLICQCTGVEWDFYGAPQFVVRSAKLTWSSE